MSTTCGFKEPVGFALSLLPGLVHQPDRPQSCTGTCRGLYHGAKAKEIAKVTAESITVGPPDDPKSSLGPLANRKYWEKVQLMVQTALDEGCELIRGAPVKPTDWKWVIVPSRPSLPS